MHWIRSLGTFFQSPFLLLIRLYWGYQFLITGYGKFLNINDIGSYFKTLGIPFPLFNAYLTASAELFGGALLLIGLFSRFSALVLTILITTALVTAERPALVSLFSNFDPDPFFMSTPFLFGYATLLIFLFGPGYFSLDKLLFFKKKNDLP